MLLQPCNISSALVLEQLSTLFCYGYAVLNPYLANLARMQTLRNSSNTFVSRGLTFHFSSDDAVNVEGY
jgi:hypothetical protein